MIAKNLQDPKIQLIVQHKHGIYERTELKSLQMQSQKAQNRIMFSVDLNSRETMAMGRKPKDSGSKSQLYLVYPFYDLEHVYSLFCISLPT